MEKDEWESGDHSEWLAHECEGTWTWGVVCVGVAWVTRTASLEAVWGQVKLAWSEVVSILQVLSNVQVISWNRTVYPVGINYGLSEYEVLAVVGVETSDEWDNEICLGCVNSGDIGQICHWISCLNVGSDGPVWEWVLGEYSSHILLLVEVDSAVLVHVVIEAIEGGLGQLHVLREVTNNQVRVTKLLTAKTDTD